MSLYPHDNYMNIGTPDYNNPITYTDIEKTWTAPADGYIYIQGVVPDLQAFLASINGNVVGGEATHEDPKTTHVNVRVNHYADIITASTVITEDTELLDYSYMNSSKEQTSSYNYDWSKENNDILQQLGVYGSLLAEGCITAETWYDILDNYIGGNK